MFALSLRALQIVLAGTIPILALARPSASLPAVNGILGALIVIIEGFQHTFKFEQFWIAYRQHGYEWQGEKFLYMMKAGPYENVPDRDVLLASRVSAIMEKQAGSWAENVLKALAKST